MRHAMRFALAAVAVGLSMGTAHPEAAFTLGPKNNPTACKDLWDAIGLPKYQDTDRNKPASSTIVCHTRYVLSHDNANKIPDWVIERLTAAQVSGDNTRPQMSFAPDELLPPAARAKDDDYKNSGFDRGHQAPSDDFNQDKKWMEETFLLSNIVPQEGKGFNQGIWKKLEERVRKLAVDRKELYVITGPIDQDRRGRSVTVAANTNACNNKITLDPLPEKSICGEKKNEDCKGAGVSVPIGLYKIIYDPSLKRANAYVMPNIDHRPLIKKSDPISYLKGFQTPVHVVEDLTGIQFFPNMPERDRRLQINQCAAMMLH